MQPNHYFSHRFTTAKPTSWLTSAALLLFCLSMAGSLSAQTVTQSWAALASTANPFGTATWTQATPRTGIIQANFHISTILNSGGIGKF